MPTPTPTDKINNQAEFDAVNVDPPNGQDAFLSQDEIDNLLFETEKHFSEAEKRENVFNQSPVNFPNFTKDDLDKIFNNDKDEKPDDFDAVNVEPPIVEGGSLTQSDIDNLLNRIGDFRKLNETFTQQHETFPQNYIDYSQHPETSTQSEDFETRCKTFNQRQELQTEKKRLLILVDAIDCKLDMLRD